MLEGTRTDYLVPGYTGFIPAMRRCEEVPPAKQKPRSEIPGYAGYVKSVKPENIIASTFGNITYDVSNEDYVKGQDLPPEHKFVSTCALTYIQPSQMLQRTAADVVGVPNIRNSVKEPTFERSGKETDQFNLTRSWVPQKKLASSAFQQRVIEKDGKPYTKLGEPLPGYTGFNRRVLAGNIFGKTYGMARESAKQDLSHIQGVMVKTLQGQLAGNPNIKP